MSDLRRRFRPGWCSPAAVRVLALLLFVSGALMLEAGCENSGPGQGNDGADGPPTIDSIVPSSQRVHEYITLNGSNLGRRVGELRFSKAISEDETVQFSVSNVYVWRPAKIQVRVPVGFMGGDGPTPIPEGAVSVQVIRADDTASNSRSFEVLKPNEGGGEIVLPPAPPPPVLAFEELTDVEAGHDVSDLLGSDEFNFARTKDAEVGDVDADGDLDILDSNSLNLTNESHSVLHLNQGDQSFSQQCLEQLLEEGDAGCGGVFAVDTETIDTFFEDGVTYDVDFADLDNDDDLDVILTATIGVTNRLRIFENGILPLGPSLFFHDNTSLWLPGASGTFPPTLSPDDLDHIDFSRDGRVDIIATGRAQPGMTSFTKVLEHGEDDESEFEELESLDAPDGVSTHDAFFVFANADSWPDVILCNETEGARSQLFLHTGDPDAQGFDLDQEIPLTDSGGAVVGALSGAAGDLNADGLDDFVLLGVGTGAVYLNDPDAVGSFASVSLPGASPHPFYDVELGDIDLDGDVDLIGAATPGGNAAPEPGDEIRIWLNGGDGTSWQALPTTDLLPGIAGIQRLSADLLDFDGDGDLDLYVAGADKQDSDDETSNRGRSPNQFFENLIVD